MVTPSAPQIDEETIRQLIKEEISKQEPRKIEINYNGIKHNLEGLIHRQFEDILKACSARLNVWLTGTAGAGKTTTLSMLTGLLTTTEGKAKVFDKDLFNEMDDVRKFMGVCP